MGTIDFWYDFASPYSYLAAIRIDALAEDAGLTVQWRPFFMGGLAKELGTRQPDVKVRYMQRDMERLCSEYGLPYRAPDPFPQNSLLVSRVAMTAQVSPQRAVFSREVFDHEFARGRSISEKGEIAHLLTEIGLEPESVLADAATDAVKQRLRDETAEALRIGLFGAPSFVLADGEVFWGHDRLDRAIAWARRSRWHAQPQA
ncbi:2-hydroxychromene-2-carboxylate isomerase [Rhodoligotrophos defluvii]|uniref:2-hydroxychromene-2-carboxylate isomerase n=1 Tax=Rhodoligotrophos defluvii TaxID=2561934 RepID=UPI0010C93CEA|nr:2-hydroxychromene-2-carboxylate isomerase [Rhodoligotrophos defluvii]